jgi:hypothetical protein
VNPYRTGAVVDYVNGAGGRIADLPGYMLDAAADAVTRIHPRCLTWRVTYLLVGDRFVRSSHRKLRDVRDAADLRLRRGRGNTICSSQLAYDTIGDR